MLMSANACLGAIPIAAALKGGADIVITGRCVDSAAALGPLIQAFRWRKVSAILHDGFRAIAWFRRGGIDAFTKDQRNAEAQLAHCRRLFAERSLGDFSETGIEVLGPEATDGRHAQPREVIVKTGARDADKEALEIFSREMAPLAFSTSTGIAGCHDGRPKVQPVVRLFARLWPKSCISARVELEGQDVPCPQRSGVKSDPATLSAIGGRLPSAYAFVRRTRLVPLMQLAYGRIGDKGDSANIGTLGRKAEYLPYLRPALSAEAVAKWFAHRCNGTVRRWHLPGILCLNCFLEQALGGGGTVSICMDSQGKAYA